MNAIFQSFENYQDQIYNDLQIVQIAFEGVEFEECTFLQASLNEVCFSNCKFKDCRFEQSDMSLCSFPHSIFAGCVFLQTKLVGIDWTQVEWAGLKLQEPFRFDGCVLSHSTFIGMRLAGLKMLDCIASDVDFREADLAGADFSGTDLTHSFFQKTNLERADLRRARNYTIQPEVNCLKKAKFAMPEAMSLLYSMDIELDAEDD